MGLRCPDILSDERAEQVREGGDGGGESVWWALKRVREVMNCNSAREGKVTNFINLTHTNVPLPILLYL